jgi:HK97 family phage prohead protease
MRHAVLKATNTATSGDTFTARITANVVDRDDEVIIPDGLKVRDKSDTFPILWGHDADRPIGRTVGPLRITPNHVTATYKLAQRPDGHVGEWLPDTAASLVKQGVLNAVSIGFRPLKARSATHADRKKYGERVRRVFTEWELLEVSIVAVPANPDALIMDVGKRCGSCVAKSLRNVIVQPARPRPRPKPAPVSDTVLCYSYKPKGHPRHVPGEGTHWIVELPGGKVKALTHEQYAKFRLHEFNVIRGDT